MSTAATPIFFRDRHSASGYFFSSLAIGNLTRRRVKYGSDDERRYDFLRPRVNDDGKMFAKKQFK